MKKLAAILMAFFMMLSLSVGVSSAFAAGTTRAQARAAANAYNKHSLGLTSVENARDLGGYKTKDGRTVKFGKLVRSFFKEGYSSIYVTEDGIRMIRGFFDELLEANGDTVLFHCVHGKDRTGNAAMLLLTVLGVDKETIIADFMLTNDYFAEEMQENYDRVYELTGSKTLATDFSYLDGVDREWIENSYKTIETHYGSMDNFLKKTIGLSNKDIQKLQKAYLK